ncbi:MAG: hypothetical protein M1832_002346 [Thelocarpon impressellum]|nr:MAG: hypothetical protein M1832_002346 [Thelocarpon impressellum]
MLADVLDVAFGRSPWVTVGLLSAGLLVAYLVRWGLQERKIRALGGHAPIKHGVPFGVDFVVRGLLAGFKHRNMELWQANFRDYDCHTIEIHPGGRRVIFTEDAENIKAILATQFQDFGKGEPFRQEWHDFLGDSIFTTDLDQWHSSRQLLRPLFIKDRVSDLQTFETHVDKLLRKIGGQGRTVDISALLFRYTLDAATDYLLGSSVGSLDDPQVEFAEAFAEVQRVQSIITRSG